MTEWDQFRQMDWERISAAMEQTLIVDGRNMFTPDEMSARGFRYVSVGRASALPQRMMANAGAGVSQVKNS